MLRHAALGGVERFGVGSLRAGGAIAIAEPFPGAAPRPRLRAYQGGGGTTTAEVEGNRSDLYLIAKRAFDILASLAATPVVVLVGLVLLVLNPAWNRGPLFYVQQRMGLDGRPFFAYKFRTMRAARCVTRGPNDPLESERITRLGAFMRRSRIDELPQFLNVLQGRMSIIGPRPDFWDHAIHYVEIVPGYRRRHGVRPGITGLAQVDCGYAEGIVATKLKTRYDLYYIRRQGFRLDAYIVWRTLAVIATGFGAR